MAAEKAESRPLLNWRNQAFFLGRRSRPKEVSPTPNLTIATADLLYFGTLLLHPGSADVRRGVQIEKLVEEKRAAIDRSNRLLRIQGVSLQSYYEQAGIARAQQKVLSLGLLTEEERSRLTDEAGILQIILTLSAKDMGHWYRMSHADWFGSV